ncbi:GNAT family N-acetyltransferase [Oceanimonas pelagia]|uniref:GNAT family N-acetyltransferase n=1 Tax=Oceanimonas pelagia TaxID=3028314 RepID=A0AA50KMY6_9GAMM|nr:GNAT family N-acetyltransferase [Oceanimonas pelagia]WMC10414.1 GNAT family N-acetyltransferase [Oceanimonas pelagia]
MESCRLKILAPSMDHASLMLEAIRESKVELSQFLDWVPFALTEEESLKNTERAITNFEKFEDELRFSLVEKVSGCFLGTVGLIIRDKEIPFFEIGYWIRSSHAGSGYVTEAVKVIEKYAFDELGARRVEIKMAVGNHKSRAVAERCGYELEGIFRNDRKLPDGQVSSTMVYAKTKP